MRRARLVYLAAPYRNDPITNRHRMAEIARAVLDLGDLPVAPHLFLHTFIDEATERDLAMETCLALLKACDEMYVVGEVTAGVAEEIAFAEKHGIPYKFYNPLEELKRVENQVEAAVGIGHGTGRVH